MVRPCHPVAFSWEGSFPRFRARCLDASLSCGWPFPHCKQVLPGPQPVARQHPLHHAQLPPTLPLQPLEPQPHLLYPRGGRHLRVQRAQPRPDPLRPLRQADHLPHARYAHTQTNRGRQKIRVTDESTGLSDCSAHPRPHRPYPLPHEGPHQGAPRMHTHAPYSTICLTGALIPKIL